MAKKIKYRDELLQGAESELIFLCGAFLLGAVFGSFFASGFTPGGPLGDLIAQTGRFKIFMLLHGTLLALIFAGPFLPFGAMAAPCSLAAEGFLLAAMVTSTVQTYGLKGYLPAVLAWFMTGIALLFLLLFMGCRSQLLAESRSDRGLRRGFGQRQLVGRYILHGMILFAFLLIIGCLHCYVADRWAVWIAEKLCL